MLIVFECSDRQVFKIMSRIISGPFVRYPFGKYETVGSVALQYLEKNSHKVAQVNYDDGVELTTDDIRLLSIRIAKKLLKIGLAEGDVALLAVNPTTHLMPLIIGCSLIGVIIAPLIPVPSMISQQVMNFPDSIQPKIVFCTDAVFNEILNSRNNFNCSPAIVTMDSKVNNYSSIFDFLEKAEGDDVAR
jgi:acyl-coenzyme A synthetase/AMP-(fatty) acid ligase